jgi:hypothetical protein
VGAGQIGVRTKFLLNSARGGGGKEARRQKPEGRGEAQCAVLTGRVVRALENRSGPSTLSGGNLLRVNGVNGLFCGSRLGMFFAFACLAGPDVEAAMVSDGDFPCTPDAFAFPEAAIEHIVGAEIALGPVTLAGGGVVAGLDEEPA